MRILGVVGWLRPDSHNRRLLRAAADELPPGAGAFIAAIRAANAVLFVK